MLENEKKSSQEVSAETLAQEVQEKAPLGNNPADFLSEIQQENARSAEDTEEKKRHEIPMLNYDNLDLEALQHELKKLIDHEKITAIKSHVEAIKKAFDNHYAQLVEDKRAQFLSQEGAEDKDFSFSLPIRDTFYKTYQQYKQLKAQHQKQLEGELKSNLERKQEIIAEIKNLISLGKDDVAWDTNTLLRKFLDLKKKWYEIGAVPREYYNDIWNNFNHHTDNFFDYLSLTRNYQENDFKQNLEKKNKLIEKAQALLAETDVQKAFRELQLLHKIWKEDTGPVEKEYREKLWEQFSAITKEIHDKRQAFLKRLEASFVDNKHKKLGIISQIEDITKQHFTSHNEYQKAIVKVNELREEFQKIGRVPQEDSEPIWQRFIEAIRAFSKQKNQFYKENKRTQNENIAKRQELIAIANAHKDSTDWEVVTPLIQKIQEDWKQIGAIPRKLSNAMWEEFREACNHYFDRLHKERKHQHKQENADIEQKKALLDQLKAFVLTGNQEEDVKVLENFQEKWNSLGKLPERLRVIDTRFNKIMSAIYKKLNFDKKQIELIKYNNKLEHMPNDDNALAKEEIFVRKKIDDIRKDILQLENNLQFFTNVDEKHPLMREALKSIHEQHEALALWEDKLKELRLREKKEEEEVLAPEAPESV
nr:DUF349 domain-containing protein [uncultured Capnocytophaga sp.]